MDFNKYYVSIDHQIYSGDEADKFLEKESDQQFYTKDGCIEVPYERWVKSQVFEESFWMKNPSANDDRNFSHLERFLGYKALREMNVPRIIEFGAGLFTNLRLIVPFLHNVKEIHLLDPLIRSYLSHPGCKYKGGKLLDFPVTLHALPIEEFETETKFDMVVMVNTVEHCISAEKIFSKINSILSPGGILVFAEAGIKAEDVEHVAANQKDIGHPLRISIEYYNSFLDGFDKLYRKDFQGLYGNKFRNDVYFIGRRK